jgi:hypothetical protein
MQLATVFLLFGRTAEASMDTAVQRECCTKNRLE